MHKRDPENLKQTKIPFNEVANEVWHREGVQIVFLCPGHLFIKQTPWGEGSSLPKNCGYRYENALSERMLISHLVSRVEREVGDIPFLIVLPDGSVYDPRLVHHAVVPMGTVRTYYRSTPGYYKPYG